MRNTIGTCDKCKYFKHEGFNDEVGLFGNCYVDLLSKPTNQKYGCIHFVAKDNRTEAEKLADQRRPRNE